MIVYILLTPEPSDVPKLRFILFWKFLPLLEIISCLTFSFPYLFNSSPPLPPPSPRLIHTHMIIQVSQTSPVSFQNYQFSWISSWFHCTPKAPLSEPFIHYLQSGCGCTLGWLLGCIPGFPYTFPVSSIFILFYLITFLKHSLWKHILKVCFAGKMLDSLNIWKCLSSGLTLDPSFGWLQSSF